MSDLAKGEQEGFWYVIREWKPVQMDDDKRKKKTKKNWAEMNTNLGSEFELRISQFGEYTGN